MLGFSRGFLRFEIVGADRAQLEDILARQRARGP